MYPDLSYIIHAITGYGPDNVFSIVKTFGLFLALAFLASGYVLKLELKRKEEEGLISARIEDVVVSRPGTWKDVLVSMLWGAFLGFKGLYAYQHFELFRTDPASVIFSALGSYSGGLAGALILGAYGYYQYHKTHNIKFVKEKRKVYPHNRVVDIAMVAAISGVAGAKLFSILENFDSFVRDPIGEIFSGSGLTVYGGYILAFFVVTRYVNKRGIPSFQIMDAAAPAIFMGYAVGRMGCQLSGDGDWGIVNEMAKPSWFIFPDGMWASSYAHNVLNEGIPIPGCTWAYCHELSPMVFPTPIWEIAITLIFFAGLWAVRRKITTPGMVFFIFLVLTGIERFFVEFFRVNPRYEFLGFQLSQAQYIALGFIVLGISAIIYLKRQHRAS